MLRHLGFIGLHLLLLWSMSPLGSQASFRILGFGQASNTNSSRVFFMPTGGMSMQQFNLGAFVMADSMSNVNAANTLFNSALLSNKESTEDPWKNVKIPWYPDSSAAEKDEEGWVPTSDTNSADSFSALVGLPVARAESNGTSWFDIETSQFSLECPSKWSIPLQDSWWKKQLGLVWGQDGFYGTISPFEWKPSEGGTPLTPGKHEFSDQPFFLDTNTEFGTRFNHFYQNLNSTSGRSSFPRRNILFGSKSYKSYNHSQPVNPDAPKEIPFEVVLRNCTIEMPYFEARVKCTAKSCGVVAMRPSLKYQSRDPVITPFDLASFAGNFFTKLPLTTGTMHTASLSAPELFIMGSDMPLASMLLLESPVPENSVFSGGIRSFKYMFEVPDDMFARRLSILLNTYYMLSTAPYAFTGNLPKPSKNHSWGAWAGGHWEGNPFKSPNSGCPGCIVGPFYSQSADATARKGFKIYKCNFVWLALLLVTSSSLLIIGGVGTILKGYCFAPDILGFVSSSTYDNKYMDLPPSGALDGMERARLLKHVTVKIGDVWTGKKIGHVAFSAGANLGGSLRADRLYV